MPEQEADHLVPLVEAVHSRVRPGHLLRPQPRVTFYPYTDAKSTIREREGRVHLRLSNQLQSAPDQVLEGVVGILLARYHRIPDSRADQAAVRAYRQFIHDETNRARRASPAGPINPGDPSDPADPSAPIGSGSIRRARGRKHIDPVGRHRSLLESYLRVALDLDLALPQVPKLSWSKHVSGHRFGHWDPDHNVVVISQILDDPDVPEFVLDYVVYHELLHILHPVRMGSGTKRIVHGAAFRRDERRFQRWKEGEEWIGKLARRAKKGRRRGFWR